MRCTSCLPRVKIRNFNLRVLRCTSCVERVHGLISLWSASLEVVPEGSKARCKGDSAWRTRWLLNSHPERCGEHALHRTCRTDLDVPVTLRSTSSLCRAQTCHSFNEADSGEYGN